MTAVRATTVSGFSRTFKIDHSAGADRTLEGWLKCTHHSLPEALHIAGCILVAFLSLAYVMCIFPQRLSDMQIRGTREGGPATGERR